MSGSGVGSWRAGGTAGMVRSQRRDGPSDSGHLFQAYVEGTRGHRRSELRVSTLGLAGPT